MIVVCVHFITLFNQFEWRIYFDLLLFHHFIHSFAAPWQTRAILTKAVFEIYTDFRNEASAPGSSSSSERKYTAQCKLCPPEFPRKSFYKNNISNLSSHLRQVSFMCLFLF